MKLKSFILTAIVLSYQVASQAQCVICRTQAETSLQEGSTEASGLNFGIMYMFLMPYLLVGVIGYVWYRNYKKTKESN